MKKTIFSLVAILVLSIATAYAAPYDGYDVTNKTEQYGDNIRTVAAFPKQGDKM